MTLTTEFPTYAELESDIEDEMAMTVSESNIVNQAELIHYCNKGIDRAEKILMALYRDYFLVRDSLTLVDATEEYALPTNIYGFKFRSMIYYSGARVYSVERLKDLTMFLEYRGEAQYGTNNDDDYRYFILNEVAGAPKMLILPLPGSGVIERWYTRQANRITLTTDVMDIPEGKDLVLAVMRHRAMLKVMMGNSDAPDVQTARAAIKEEEGLFRNALAEMVVDGANDIEADHSHYEEHE